MVALDAENIARIRRSLARGGRFAEALEVVPQIVSVAAVSDVDKQIRHEIFGAGTTIGPLLEDPSITDVVVNGPGEIWVDRGAGMERIVATDPQLETEEGVRELAVRLAARCGQRLDDASPIVDGTFSSGIRLHALIPPLAAGGTCISLRTHRSRVFTMDELLAGGTVPRGLEDVIRALVDTHCNVMISGSTGAGKTTFLNTMLSMTKDTERIVIIEDSAELAPAHPHVLHLQVRHANVQGAGEVSMSELVRAAMRMRPDRIVLGECRGAEVRDVLGALNTGHEGGWATIHANSAVDVPARLVALGALARMNEQTVAAQASAALDAIIHLAKRNGRRGIAQISTLARRHGELEARIAFDVDNAGIVREGPQASALRARLGLT